MRGKRFISFVDSVVNFIDAMGAPLKNLLWGPTIPFQVLKNLKIFLVFANIFNITQSFIFYFNPPNRCGPIWNKFPRTWLAVVAVVSRSKMLPKSFPDKCHISRNHNKFDIAFYTELSFLPEVNFD